MSEQRQGKYESNGWPSIARPDLKPPTGWNLDLVTGISRLRHHAPSPDGSQIAFVWERDDAADIYCMAASGGWPRRLSFGRQPVAYWSDTPPAWSPDGRWLAFGMHGHVWLLAAAGGLPVNISDFSSGAWGPVWLPDGRLIVAVERHDSTQLLITDVHGGWPRALVVDTHGDAWDPQPAPDGLAVAYTWRPFDDLNRLDIRVVDVASGQTVTLVGRPRERNRQPRWSPDGATLAFISERDGWNHLWLCAADGDQARRLTQEQHDIEEYAWSPDGAQIACVINRDGALDLLLVDVRDGTQRDLARGHGVYMRPRWARDGQSLTAEYESWQQPPDIVRIDLDGHQRALTHSMPPALAAAGLIEPQRVHYRSSDDLEIPAFLYRPRTPNGAAIVHPHGGPSSQYLFEWDILAQYFVAKGYTWLAPNYRGSTGYGVPFEHANYGDWGLGDTQDCLAGARYLHTLPGIDAQRIGIYGGSYGGYMTVCCLSRDPDYLFACGVNKYGDANILSSWAQCNRDLRLYTEIFLGHPAANLVAYRAGSPIHEVDAVQRPVLVLHGLLDDVVPPQASEEWVAALRQAGKTFEYKTYPDEPHGFLKPANQRDAYSRMERFLDWYLLPARGRLPQSAVSV